MALVLLGPQHREAGPQWLVRGQAKRALRAIQIEGPAYASDSAQCSQNTLTKIKSAAKSLSDSAMRQFNKFSLKSPRASVRIGVICELR